MLVRFFLLSDTEPTPVAATVAAFSSGRKVFFDAFRSTTLSSVAFFDMCTAQKSSDFLRHSNQSFYLQSAIVTGIKKSLT